MVQSGEAAFENLTVLKILVPISLAWNSLCLSSTLVPQILYKANNINVCFKFPDPTYTWVFGPTLNSLLLILNKILSNMLKHCGGVGGGCSSEQCNIYINYFNKIKWAATWQNQQKMSVHPSKTRISLGTCPVWSESSLCAPWVAKDPMFLNADSEDSDQTGMMPRLIWVSAGRTCHFVGFVMRRLK